MNEDDERHGAHRWYEANERRHVVEIGLRDIYESVRRLERETASVAHILQSITDRSVDQEARLRVLERGRWPLPSLAALISIAALVVGFINMKG